MVLSQNSMNLLLLWFFSNNFTKSFHVYEEFPVYKESKVTLILSDLHLSKSSDLIRITSLFDKN